MSKTLIAYIGLGGNLDDPLAHVRSAFDDIDMLLETQLLARSDLYLTKSFLPGQPDYINAVAKIITGLTAQTLLQELLAIEDQHGRVRAEKWGPRTLDLDLLLYANDIIDEPNLTVPHPHMHECATVLYPLADIAAELILPDGKALKDLLSQVPPVGVKKIEELP